MTKTREYQLQESITRVVRSAFQLAGDETIDLDPETAREYDDVLEPVDGDWPDTGEDGDGDGDGDGEDPDAGDEDAAGEEDGDE